MYFKLEYMKILRSTNIPFLQFNIARDKMELLLLHQLTCVLKASVFEDAEGRVYDRSSNNYFQPSVLACCNEEPMYNLSQSSHGSGCEVFCLLRQSYKSQPKIVAAK
jgi:hypothetical protein